MKDDLVGLIVAMKRDGGPPPSSDNQTTPDQRLDNPQPLALRVSLITATPMLFREPMKHDRGQQLGKPKVTFLESLETGGPEMMEGSKPVTKR